ncbi:hypothetical protein Tco_1362868 [Tanacetum coccineum]
MGIDYVAGVRLKKLRPDEAWATIEELAQYEDEGWNDTVILGEESLNYENPNIEQLLGIMERKVDTLMKDAISLLGRSEGVFKMTTNKMYQPPPDPSRQEEFKHIVMNFILDQEERVRQLEEYIKEIIGDFIQLSSEFTRRVFKSGVHQMCHDALARRRISIGISSPAKLVREFFASFEFDASPCMYDPNHLGIRQSKESATLSGLRKVVRVKANYLLLGFWPNIGDDGFNVGNAKVAAIRDPRVKLAHRCIATTIAEEDKEDDESDEEAGGGAGHKGAGGPADMYRNMS